MKERRIAIIGAGAIMASTAILSKRETESIQEHWEEKRVEDQFRQSMPIYAQDLMPDRAYAYTSKPSKHKNGRGHTASKKKRKQSRKDRRN